MNCNQFVTNKTRINGGVTEKNITTPGKALWIFLMSGNKTI